MKILFVTSAHTGGGAERSINTLANTLTSKKISVQQVVINAGASDIIEPLHPVFYLDRNPFGSLLNTFKSWYKYQDIVFKNKPDYIVLNCDLPEFFGAFTFTHARLVCVEHASRPWPKRDTFGVLIRYILRFRGAIWITVSPHLTIWPFGFKPHIQISNPVKLSSSEFISKPQLSGSRLGGKLFFIGRLSEEKDPKLALEVAGLLGREIVILGTGILLEELKKYSYEKGIQANFVGFVESPWGMITEDDLVLVTSKAEGDGLVVVEAILQSRNMLLRQNGDLLKFGLPKINYCESPTAFAERAEKFFAGQINLLVPLETVAEMRTERNPEKIAQEWINYFQLN